MRGRERPVEIGLCIGGGHVEIALGVGSSPWSVGLSVRERSAELAKVCNVHLAIVREKVQLQSETACS